MHLAKVIHIGAEAIDIFLKKSRSDLLISISFQTQF